MKPFLCLGGAERAHAPITSLVIFKKLIVRFVVLENVVLERVVIKRALPKAQGTFFL